jgi:hypothetical protein
MAFAAFAGDAEALVVQKLESIRASKVVYSRWRFKGNRYSPFTDGSTWVFCK